jgi:hypothetical protein
MFAVIGGIDFGEFNLGSGLDKELFAVVHGRRV